MVIGAEKIIEERFNPSPISGINAVVYFRSLNTTLN
jgi:hypothetical protein